MVRESTRATSRPAGSVRVSETVSAPVRVTRTRSSVAPEAYRRTPLQANGTRIAPASAGTASSGACVAASNSAGWSPNRPAPAVCGAGSRTSAKTSSPQRQTAPTPWKAGPYASPAPARAAYAPVRSTASAASGGHGAGSSSAARPRPSCPETCRVHGTSSADSSGRA